MSVEQRRHDCFVNSQIRENVSVLVRNGRIEWIRGDAELPNLDDVVRINGNGRYLAPGLTDMHVHTHDDSDYLLHLAYGVTTIREMNGWPWRLKRRQMVEAGKLLAPNMYVTSQILNSSDLGGYALPLATEAEARAAVKSATSTAANTLGWADRTGQILPGMSADFLLLDKNPLEKISNLRTVQAVMVRGVWLPNPGALPVTGKDLNCSPTAPNRQQLEAAVTQAELHVSAGYAQSTISLDLWVGLATELGENDLANRLRRLGE